MNYVPTQSLTRSKYTYRQLLCSTCLLNNVTSRIRVKPHRTTTSLFKGNFPRIPLAGKFFAEEGSGVQYVTGRLDINLGALPTTEFSASCCLYCLNMTNNVSFNQYL